MKFRLIKLIICMSTALLVTSCYTVQGAVKGAGEDVGLVTGSTQSRAHHSTEANKVKHHKNWKYHKKHVKHKKVMNKNLNDKAAVKDNLHHDENVNNHNQSNNNSY